MTWHDDPDRRADMRAGLPIDRHPTAPYRSALRPQRRRRSRWKDWLARWLPRLDARRP